MNSKEEICRVFNDKLNEFVSDLVAINNDPGLLAFKTSLCMIVMVCEKKPIRLFKKHVIDLYGVQIIERDENFFLSKDDYQEECDDSFDISNSLIGKIKNDWKDLSSANKDIIWKYLKLLKILGEKFANL